MILNIAMVSGVVRPSSGGPGRTELSLSQKAIVVSLIRFSGQIKQEG